MKKLLHLLQQCTPLIDIRLSRLLRKQLVNFRIAAIDKCAALDNKRLKTRRGIPERAACTLNQSFAELLLGIALEEGCPFERSQSRPNAGYLEVIENRFAQIGVVLLRHRIGVA